MRQICAICLEAAAAAVFLIPIFFYLHKTRFHSVSRSILLALFSLYLATAYALAGLPNIIYIRFAPKFNFVPFQYMFSDYRSSLLNVALFVPLGFFLPVLWKRFSGFFTVALTGFGVSALIELLQIFTYRATDINDLMTNTLGTVVGFLLARPALKMLPAVSPREDSADLKTVIAAVLGVMVFLHPFASRLVFHFLPA